MKYAPPWKTPKYKNASPEDFNQLIRQYRHTGQLSGEKYLGSVCSMCGRPALPNEKNGSGGLAMPEGHEAALIAICAECVPRMGNSMAGFKGPVFDIGKPGSKKWGEHYLALMYQTIEWLKKLKGSVAYRLPRGSVDDFWARNFAFAYAPGRKEAVLVPFVVQPDDPVVYTGPVVDEALEMRELVKKAGGQIIYTELPGGQTVMHIVGGGVE